MYTDNYVHAKFEPKIQNMSKIQLLIMIFHGGSRENIHGGFVEIKKNTVLF